jgi:hypothetical protein
MSSPRSSGLGEHSSNTYLDSLISAPSSENDIFLRGTGRALAGGGQKYHAVHVTVVGRVYDILRRDTELCAWGRRACEYDVAIGALQSLVDAIARFEIGGAALRTRIAIEEFMCKPRGRCAR